MPVSSKPGTSECQESTEAPFTVVIGRTDCVGGKLKGVLPGVCVSYVQPALRENIFGSGAPLPTFQAVVCAGYSAAVFVQVAMQDAAVCVGGEASALRKIGIAGTVSAIANASAMTAAGLFRKMRCAFPHHLLAFGCALLVMEMGI